MIETSNASDANIFSSTPRRRGRSWLSWKYSWWLLLFILAMIVLIDDLPLLSSHNPYRWYHLKVQTVLIPHAIFGIFAIIAGPVQFSTRMRQRYPSVHRFLGRSYVIAILIAAPMGALIPIIGPKDLFFTIGVGIHALAWFVTALVAFLTAKNRNIAEHRQWAVRSYVLTFSFVLTRTILIPIAANITIHQFGLVDVINNFFYLFATDVVLCWREITTSSVVSNASQSVVASDSGAHAVAGR